MMPGMPGNPALGKSDNDQPGEPAAWSMSPGEERADRLAQRAAANPAPTPPTPPPSAGTMDAAAAGLPQMPPTAMSGDD